MTIQLTQPYEMLTSNERDYHIMSTTEAATLHPYSGFRSVVQMYTMMIDNHELHGTMDRIDSVY